MPFRKHRPCDAFQHALRAAVASQRPGALHALLAIHGDRARARALSDLCGRAIADALAMLPAPDRTAVLRRLPRPAQRHLREAEGQPAHAPLPTWSAACASPLLLLC